MNNVRATEKQILASDPESSAWVAANAGSGKTHVLVDRVIRLMLAGTEPSRILCLTFTKAAAAEMASRLFERLSGWIGLDDRALTATLEKLGAIAGSTDSLRLARRLFTRALETPGGLKIQTIHAFCERLLQLFPVEAGVVPGFTVMDDRTSREALEAARDRVLAGAQADPAGELGQALAEVVRHVQADAFNGLIGEILSKRAELPEVLSSRQGIDGAIGLLRAALGLSPGEDRDSVLPRLAISADSYARLAETLSGGSEKDEERAATILDVLGTGTTSLLDLRDLLLTQKNEPRKLPGIATKAVLRNHPWIEDFITAEQNRLADGIARLADLERLAATGALLILAGEIAGEFERLKRRAGTYDFDDLIARTRQLVANRPDAAWVLYKLDGGIEHVLIDEAQDTSPAQWDIVRSLTAEFFAGKGVRQKPERTLFAVGDRKQSIYSFQGADPEVFEIVHGQFKSRIEAAGQAFNDVDFTVSFRSTAEILDAVDAVFHEDAVARRGLDGKRSKILQHESKRRGEPGLVELWPPIEPEEREERQPWIAPVDREPANSPRRRLAQKIARTVKSWIGRRLIEATGAPVRPGDILILVRTRSGFFDALVRELRNEAVPVAGADRLQLTGSIAVLDLLALARFCLLPQDDHSLACLLKSPLVPQPLSEEQIFDLAWQRGTRPLWQRLTENRDERCIAAHRQLSAWLASANRRPFEFFADVLAECRKRILARLGGEAGDALDAFLDLALAYEQDHSSSLAGFIAWFVAGESEIKRNMEQESGEVRIMTVHGAKGLEAPIVILPDTADVPDARRQSSLMMVDVRHDIARLPFWRLAKRPESSQVAAWKAEAKEEQAHEYRRLLYVAMTRARDELYICGYRGVRDPPDDCWYNMMAPVLKPVMREIAGADGISLSWRLGSDPRQAGEARRLPPVDKSLPAWIGSKPAPPAVADAWQAPSRLGRERTGTAELQRRGVLLHKLLQHLPDVAPDMRGDFARRVITREKFDESLWAELQAVLDAPQFAAFFAPGSLSEVPVIARLERLGRIISGRIDRLAVTAGAVTILDYKTGHNWPETAAQADPNHILQLAAYREAVRQIYPGRAIRAALLWTAAPKLVEIPASMLDRALNPT
ncbi:MAG TPA: double-strand break repair helicase AddA [Aestuariivirga sp.]|nr:double-strand break repair helicase AddA [Aestuariivirga sp.]